MRTIKEISQIIKDIKRHYIEDFQYMVIGATNELDIYSEEFEEELKAIKSRYINQTNKMIRSNITHDEWLLYVDSTGKEIENIYL